MNWNKWIRQSHRWIAIAFTAGVAINIVAMWGGRTPAPWVYACALAPLAVLFFTGLYLFVLPYFPKRHERASDPLPDGAGQ
ncbi:MAG: hypothetical protein IT161_05960 [Bryobacterales bacterium]|nr:hypothetical protein [Bryobacterales bacterium]